MKIFPGYINQKTSLKTVLILPYVILVILLAISIGYLFYSTGNNAVLRVSNQLLEETVHRIGEAVERHVIGSLATLEAAFPKDMRGSGSIESEFDVLVTRFWIATSLYMAPNSYVYYGNKEGQAIGVYRYSYDFGELWVKYKAEEHRKKYRIDGINSKPVFEAEEKKLFEPRIRPWYLAGQKTLNDTWTSVYIDFSTLDLVTTRVRRILDEKGDFQGVVATDMPLQALNDLVKTLEVSPNGIAFIIENNGKLIASSCCKNVQNTARVDAGESGHTLLDEVYDKMQPYIKQWSSSVSFQTFLFTDSTGKDIHVGLGLFKDGSGLEWFHVVAMPSADYLGGIQNSVFRTLLIAVIATIIVILVGLWILNWVTTDLKLLSVAVNKVGKGDIEEPLTIQRNDEIGELARSFRAMQCRLRTDHLTGLPNRYALEQYIHKTIRQCKAKEDGEPTFATLFLDINDFKYINDTFGHNVGDQALIEFAKRLKNNIRSNDFVCRYAGDEFVVVLHGVPTKEDLLQIQSNIENELSKPFNIQERSLKIDGSCGGAIFPEDGDSMEEFMIVADRLMYANKVRTKHRCSSCP